MVSPGSSIVLDCVFMRIKGTPEWSWTISNNTKDYITGWVTSGPEDEQWLYRLELVNVSIEVDYTIVMYLDALALDDIRSVLSLEL